MDICSCQADMGRGCHFCNCGTETKATPSEGCYKLHELDWMDGFPNNLSDEIVEVRFKNTRKGFYRNTTGASLGRGDIVAVEASPGHDIGIVSLTGDIVARQMKRVGFTPFNGEFRKVYRKAKPYDIEKWQEAIAMEHDTMIRSRQIAADMKLNMKIGDVEYQGDKIKAIFYYIADERVDFRELIKVFAEQFHIRIEMKQIGARQEAGRIGGLGSCGRELCCASWVSSFVSITTNSARHQEISLNPQKLAGQCSKLKCCLVYELDAYLDARKEFPRLHGPLQALDGDYFLVKSDILGRTMSFSTSPGEMANIVVLPVGRVKEVLEANKRGKKVDKIAGDIAIDSKTEDPGFVNVIGEESITRFDEKKERGARKMYPEHGNRGRGNVSRNGFKERDNGNKPEQAAQPAARQNNDRNSKTGGAQPRQEKSANRQSPDEYRHGRRNNHRGKPGEGRGDKGGNANNGGNKG